MSDERPRPRYGEYATPQEQRARIQQSGPLPSPASPSAPRPPVPAAGGHRGTTPQAARAARSGPVAGTAAHPVDRIVTLALLAYGALNVVMSVFSFLDLAAVADTTYRMMGIAGSFTDTPAARAWGIAAAVVLVAGYALTAWLALRTMRRGRLAWWIPLVGAVVTYAVVSACVSVPLMGDPAFVHYLGAR